MSQQFKLIKEEFSEIHQEWQWTYQCLFVFVFKKKVIKKIVLPTISLFVIGCLFSYYVAIPYTLDFLYQYGQAISVLTFFEITPFILNHAILM